LQTADIIYRYFPDLDQQQRLQFAGLHALYADWNERINVISRKDIDNLYINHVLHSLGIAKIVRFLPGTAVMDVGTGGGFPGIPLAILFPDTKFHLVDSIGKKITVVTSVASALRLTNVKGEQLRAEQAAGRYDFVVSRAVTRLREFYGWVHQKIKPDSEHALHNGILYLKGGDLAEECEALKRPTQIFELSNFFSEPFFETKKVVFVAV
jgi:16S rRNA (guanine527-N7)-methyltransferase